MGLFVKFRVSCDHPGCKESVDVEVDWADVTVDLNTKKIFLPTYPIRDAGWQEYVGHEGYGASGNYWYISNYYCPKHKRGNT